MSSAIGGVLAVASGFERLVGRARPVARVSVGRGLVVLSADLREASARWVSLVTKL
jgi:hypothetical protein